MIRDLVAALDWVKEHIGEYGGNPKKIAEAHLVALLTAREGTLPSCLYGAIQKVVLLSGTYDLLAYKGDRDFPWEKAIKLLFLKLFEGKKNLPHFSPVL